MAPSVPGLGSQRRLRAPCIYSSLTPALLKRVKIHPHGSTLHVTGLHTCACFVKHEVSQLTQTREEDTENSTDAVHRDTEDVTVP